jgi:hypothetical protein
MSTEPHPPSVLPSTGVVMRGSALVLGGLGLALLLAPEEMARLFGWSGGSALSGLAAAGLLAVAALDWMGRGAIYGGIYGRPIVVANLMMSLTGGLGLLDAQLRSHGAHPWGWLPVAALAAHGLGFGLVLVGRIGGPPR